MVYVFATNNIGRFEPQISWFIDERVTARPNGRRSNHLEY